MRPEFEAYTFSLSEQDSVLHINRHLHFFPSSPLQAAHQTTFYAVSLIQHSKPPPQVSG
jgi:hypothetical protein